MKYACSEILFCHTDHEEMVKHTNNMKGRIHVVSVFTVNQHANVLAHCIKRPTLGSANLVFKNWKMFRIKLCIRSVLCTHHKITCNYKVTYQVCLFCYFNLLIHGIYGASLGQINFISVQLLTNYAYSLNLTFNSCLQSKGKQKELWMVILSAHLRRLSWDHMSCCWRCLHLFSENRIYVTALEWTFYTAKFRWDISCL